MFNKNKYGENKVKRKNNNKKFLNNKKDRKEIFNDNQEYSTSLKNESSIENNKKIRKDIYEIAGYYYDNEKNRYFPLNYKQQRKISKEGEIELKKNKNENIRLSNFNLIHVCKIKEKRVLKTYCNRIKALKNSNFINFEYEGDKLPNNIYNFYLNRYLLILDYFSPNTGNINSNNFTTIIIHDVINNKFIKKIEIEDFYNDFMIKENNLILLDNITKISIIKDINKIIESKESNIILKYINKFKIRIDNIERISMVYKWPLINIINECQYYYLIWNNFYFFDTSKINNEIIIKNSDIIYLSKNQIIKYKNDLKINKVNIDKKNHYINFFINFDSNGNKKIIFFYLFTVIGEIHCYLFNKNDKFKLKKIITNEILKDIQIINIIPFKNDNNYLMISNQNDIFNLNLKNQTMTKIIYNENNQNKSIKYKTKIFKFFEDLNCLVFDDNNYIKVLSLEDFIITKKFLYNDHKYNILIINKTDLIIV